MKCGLVGLRLDTKRYSVFFHNPAVMMIVRYKERIRTKLIKSMTPKSVSKFLNTKDWTFAKDGLDDFRDGLPPPAHDDDLIQVCYAFLICVIHTNSSVYLLEKILPAYAFYMLS